MQKITETKQGKRKREADVSILSQLFWTVQPPKGLVYGNYYREENYFAPHFPGDRGYHGILEVVIRDKKIQLVEFNEINADSYYIKKYQGVSKRLSDYSFFQAGKARTEKTGIVLVNGITHVEEQMIMENRLTGPFDLLTGASNSIKRSMIPLAEKIAARLETPSKQIYYSYSKSVEPGVTGRLQLTLEKGRIIDFQYDEIFADTPEEIEDKDCKKYYRQSKYHSLEYISTAGAGFNSIMDLLCNHILQTQNLTNLDGLPFVDSENRMHEWDHYLNLALEMQKTLQRDGFNI